MLGIRANVVEQTCKSRRPAATVGRQLQGLSPAGRSAIKMDFVIGRPIFIAHSPPSTSILTLRRLGNSSLYLQAN